MERLIELMGKTIEVSHEGELVTIPGSNLIHLYRRGHVQFFCPARGTPFIESHPFLTKVELTDEELAEQLQTDKHVIERWRHENPQE